MPADIAYTTSVAGEDIVITFNEGTKSDGTITTENGIYSFSYSADGTLSIEYPNGYTYSERDENGAILVSWPYPETAEELGYIDGFSLAWSISAAIDGSKTGYRKSVPVIVSLVIIIFGIGLVYSPRSAWWFGGGWRYKDVEASDFSLTLYRLIGGIIVFAGIVSFFV
jgi:uncharacterized protein YjeT (DUF2065 family)